MKVNDLTFEQAMEKLQIIVEKLENNNASLDESIANYKEGLELSKFCDQKLNSAEKEIATIMTEDGEKPFKVDGEE